MNSSFENEIKLAKEKAKTDGQYPGRSMFYFNTDALFLNNTKVQTILEFMETLTDQNPK